MIEVPQLGNRFLITLVGFFDLGFLAKKQDGSDVQLRVPEMKEELVASFRNRSFPPVKTDFDEHLGKQLWVYEFAEYPTRVSQYSQLELDLKIKRSTPAIMVWNNKLNDFPKK
ncbi:MAG: hypothetical protein V7785_00570 [Bermanella sp.]